MLVRVRRANSGWMCESTFKVGARVKGAGQGSRCREGGGVEDREYGHEVAQVRLSPPVLHIGRRRRHAAAAAAALGRAAAAPTVTVGGRAAASRREGRRCLRLLVLLRVRVMFRVRARVRVRVRVRVGIAYA